MLRIQKLQENKEFDCCVLCGKRTEYAKDVPVDKRIGYIEGAGQLCTACYKETYPKSGADTGKSLYAYCIERDDFTLLSQWDNEKNGGLTVRNISHGSHKKVWWRCAFGHSWEAPVYSRTVSGSGCPYCAGKKLLPYARTLASEHPQLLKQWHPTLNTGISPEEISPGSHQKVWWKCEKGHAWKAQVKSRVNGTGCPICSNRKVNIGENDLSTTHPEIAAQWHPTKNGSRTPQAVFGGHHAKVWWQCDKGHAWQASILSRTSLGNGVRSARESWSYRD